MKTQRYFLPRMYAFRVSVFTEAPLSDSAIVDIAFISKKLGGPLSNVFAKAVTYDRSDLDNVVILAV